MRRLKKNARSICSVSHEWTEILADDLVGWSVGLEIIGRLVEDVRQSDTGRLPVKFIYTSGLLKHEVPLNFLKWLRDF